jgi:ribosomal protein RSM22 (predicted rRNA methylase)
MEQALLEYERGAVSAFLSANANSQFSQGDIAKSELQEIVTAIKELSANYVVNQAPRKLSALHAKAYALYYAPINFAKIWHLLAHAPELTNSKGLKILDYGCGTGTASFACAAKLPGIQSILGVDASTAMIETAKSLSAQLAGSANCTFTTNLESYKSQKFNLIIAANVFNELRGNGQREQLFQSLQSCLCERGTLIILEPALQQSAHQLVELRDHVVATYPQLGILFPCTHKNPCPMRLKEEIAWCHFQLSWNTPRLISQLDDASGFNKHRLKYSALVLKQGTDCASGLRILSEPKKSRKGLEVNVCGEASYGPKIFAPKALIGKKLHWGMRVDE